MCDVRVLYKDWSEMRSEERVKKWYLRGEHVLHLSEWRMSKNQKRIEVLDAGGCPSGRASGREQLDLRYSSKMLYNLMSQFLHAKCQDNQI